METKYALVLTGSTLAGLRGRSGVAGARGLFPHGAGQAHRSGARAGAADDQGKRRARQAADAAGRRGLGRRRSRDLRAGWAAGAVRAARRHAARAGAARVRRGARRARALAGSRDGRRGRLEHVGRVPRCRAGRARAMPADDVARSPMSRRGEPAPAGYAPTMRGRPRPQSRGCAARSAKSRRRRRCRPGVLDPRGVLAPLRRVPDRLFHDLRRVVRSIGLAAGFAARRGAGRRRA